MRDRQILDGLYDPQLDRRLRWIAYTYPFTPRAMARRVGATLRWWFRC